MAEPPPGPGPALASATPGAPPAASGPGGPPGPKPPLAVRARLVAAELRKPLQLAKLGILASSAVAAVALRLLYEGAMPHDDLNRLLAVPYTVFGGTLMWLMTAWLKGPKLQFLNLSILFSVILLTIDYPNPPLYIALNVGLGATLDAILSRWRFGGWRMPWPTMVGSLGISLVVDGFGLLPFILLPLLMVASKHLIRWRGKHLFNPNNFAASVLLLLYMVRVGVNDWGAAPQTLALMLLFGTISISRVKRLDLALFYIVFSFAAYGAIALLKGWGPATVFTFAFAPLNVIIGFFAITDPATSPDDRRAKALWALLIVLIAVPATLTGRAEAPVFALLAAAPQRHLITFLTTGKWPAKAAPHGPPKPAPSSAAAAAATAAVLPQTGGKP